MLPDECVYVHTEAVSVRMGVEGQGVCLVSVHGRREVCGSPGECVYVRGVTETVQR